MTRDDWWTERAYPLYEAIDASMDLPDGTSAEKRLAVLTEKCPWLYKLPGAVPVDDDTPATEGEATETEPEWTPVEGSSTIDAVRTEPRSIGVKDLARLFVRFKSGGTYRYEDVPGSVIVDLLIADSPGGYFAANIKGKYLTTLVADAERTA